MARNHNTLEIGLLYCFDPYKLVFTMCTSKTSFQIYITEAYWSTVSVPNLTKSEEPSLRRYELSASLKADKSLS